MSDADDARRLAIEQAHASHVRREGSHGRTAPAARPPRGEAVDPKERLIWERSTLFEAAGDGICTVSPDGNIVAVNAAAAAITGYDPAELIGLPMHLTLHHTWPDGRPYPVEECPLAATLHDGNIHRVDSETFWRKDGSAVPVEYTAAPVRDGETTVGAIVIFRDITDRVRATARLTRLNRALRVISECNSVLVREREESRLLDAVCRLLIDTGGYRMSWVGFAEADEGKRIRVVAQAGDGVQYIQRLRPSWGDGENGDGPSGRSIRLGRPIVMQDIATDPAYAPWRAEAIEHGFSSSVALPLRDRDRTFGTLRVYAGVPDAFDGEEVELLEQLAADLAYGIVALRTRADRERQAEALVGSERLASLGRLAAGIGHELKNPLTVVAGRAHMMRAQMTQGTLPESPALARHVASLEEATQRMTKIMQGLSTYARPSTPEPVELSMADLVTATAELLAYEARRHQVSIAMDIPAAVPPILGDRSQLMQVLVNLASNAIEAMTAGGRLTFHVRVVETTGAAGSKPEARVLTTVEDAGPGIAPETLARIWDPFFTTKPEGTGLGLSIVRGIVADLPGATIDVETALGRGSRFTLALPVAATPGPPEPPRASAS